jgi:hypothetical protein
MKSWWRNVWTGDRRFLAIVIGALIVVTSIPFLYGMLRPPAGYQYNGLQSLSPGDTPVYYSYIRQASLGGGPVLYDLFTPEYRDTGLLQPVWWVIGVSAQVLHLSPPWIFYLSRLVLIVPFVIVAWWFVGLFFSGQSRRRGLLWLLFTTGLGVYALPFFVSGPLRFTPSYWAPQDVWVPEAVTFLALYRTPHFIISIGCLLSIIIFVVRATEQRRWRWVIAAALTSLALFSFHPYYMPTVYGMLGLYAVGIFFQRRQIDWWLVMAVAVIGVISAPAALYHVFALYQHWPLAVRGLQNHIPGPPPLSILIGYGFLWPLAIIGIWSVRRTLRPAHLAAMSLLMVNTVLVLVPVQFQSKYFEGLQPMLAIFAALGLTVVGQRLARRGWTEVSANGGVRPWGNQYIGVMIFVALLCMTNVFVIARDVYYVVVRPPQALRILYLTDATRDAFAVLATLPQGLVAAPPMTAALIPGYTSQPVFLGHGHETLFPQQRNRALYQFFLGTMTPEAKIAWLAKNSIRYVVIDNEVLLASESNLDLLPGLTVRFGGKEIKIYEVTQ